MFKLTIVLTKNYKMSYYGKLFFYSLTINIFKLMFKLTIVLTKNYKMSYYGKL